ncbi:MAG: ATP-binding cassette domain-containing protein [Planctomycetes bacterium]|nr:ATP-binding cassette domain-containing protein [Planctomycetota bacterium]
MSGVCFTFPDGTRALHDVDFHADEGEFVALLASNGSGKTTLIKVLVGLLTPQEGSVRLGGMALADLSAPERYQAMGVVLQNPVDQLFAATVEEDVAFGPRNLGLPESEVQQRVSDALEAVSASELRGRAIHHLSFGQQKRVSLAGVLAMRPSILILDEPTAGLDPSGEAAMMRLLHRLNRSGHITIVLATHSVDLLPLFADRIYVLRHGRVLKVGTAQDIFCDQEVIEQASLRLPYVSALLYEMKHVDGVPIHGLPLTVGEARHRLLELIPEDLLLKPFEEKAS